jgi:hypothetical protein
LTVPILVVRYVTSSRIDKVKNTHMIPVALTDVIWVGEGDPLSKVASS